MTEVHVCELMRCTDQDEWFKYHVTAYLTIDAKGGVTLRESSSNTLIMDLPASAIGSSEWGNTILQQISSAHVIQDSTIRIITSGDSKIALQFVQSPSLQTLLTSYETHGVPVCITNDANSFDQFGNDESNGQFPNVHDPAVQEVLLRILFSAPFEDFVKDLQDWLRSTKDRLS